MNRIRNVSVIVGLGLMITSAIVPVASAGNFAYGGCSGTYQECWQSNKNLYMYYDANLPTSWEQASTSARVEEYEPIPGWNTYYGSHADADVHYLRNDTIGTNVFARYTCATLGGNGTCAHGHVHYNHQWSGLTASQKKKVACHETGHSVGLRHPAAVGLPNNIDPYGCMVQDLIPGNYTGHLVHHNEWHLQNTPPY